MARQTRVPGDVRLETQRRTTARGMRKPVIDLRAGGRSMMTLHPISFVQVLPGDTLKGMSIQSRIVSKPTDSEDAAVTGMWFEHWHFYVRVGDLPTYAEAMRNLVANISTAGAPNAAQLEEDMMAAVHKGYFLDEGEVATSPFRLRWPGQDWLDTAVPVSQLPGSDTITDDWDDQWLKYEAMRRAKLTTNTFEEWLAKQGVSVPPQLRVEHDPEMKKPELLHFGREFAYPQPTANPSGTALAHSVQWFLQDRFTRARFCAEPGWIASFMAVRPKAYLVNAAGTPNGPQGNVLDDLGWFPPEFDTDPHTSLMQVPGSYFVADGQDTVAYPEALVVDRRDALLYGFGTAFGGVQTFARHLDRRPTAADVAKLPTFTLDWHASLHIASRVSKDTTF